MTAGLDLAAMPERTALASIEWAETRAIIRDVICPAGDDVILEVIGQTSKTGIDCPFGWPDAFIDFVAAHRSGHVALLPDGLGTGWRRPLTMRRTDAVVHDKLRLVPLSVSADRIAHVALRCAVLLASLIRLPHHRSWRLPRTRVTLITENAFSIEWRPGYGSPMGSCSTIRVSQRSKPGSSFDSRQRKPRR